MRPSCPIAGMFNYDPRLPVFTAVPPAVDARPIAQRPAKIDSWRFHTEIVRTRMPMRIPAGCTRCGCIETPLIRKITVVDAAGCVSTADACNACGIRESRRLGKKNKRQYVDICAPKIRKHKDHSIRRINKALHHPALELLYSIARLELA